MTSSCFSYILECEIEEEQNDTASCTKLNIEKRMSDEVFEIHFTGNTEPIIKIAIFESFMDFVPAIFNTTFPYATHYSFFKINHTAFLDKSFFQHASQIRSLSITGINFDYVQSNIFESLPHLEELELAEPKTKNLTRPFFETNTELMKLTVEGSFFVITPDVFHNISKDATVTFKDDESCVKGTIKQPELSKEISKSCSGNISQFTLASINKIQDALNIHFTDSLKTHAAVADQLQSMKINVDYLIKKANEFEDYKKNNPVMNIAMNQQVTTYVLIGICFIALIGLIAIYLIVKK